MFDLRHSATLGNLFLTQIELGFNEDLQDTQHFGGRVRLCQDMEKNIEGKSRGHLHTWLRRIAEKACIFFR